VQRALVQVLQPFLDPRFLNSSLGYRPRKGREHALALAEARATSHGLWVWAAEDIRDAFDHVPHKRLLEVLRRPVPAADILALVEVVIGTDRGRGLPQGGALSPLLLNLYLDRVLDRPWTKAHPEAPLLRVADDLLVLAGDREQAVALRAALEALLRPAGMPLHETKGALRDLAAGQTLEWLGYDLRRGDRGLEARLTGRSWEQLDGALAGLHDGPDAPIRAVETIEGWIAQQGPCYRHEDVDEVYARIGRLAGRYAFEEVPDRGRVRSLWGAAHDRYGDVRRTVSDADR
jgi:hypothetical protein